MQGVEDVTIKRDQRVNCSPSAAFSDPAGEERCECGCVCVGGGRVCVCARSTPSTLLSARKRQMDLSFGDVV